MRVKRWSVQRFVPVQYRTASVLFRTKAIVARFYVDFV